MKVKRFQANSYREALAQVKSALGPDAVILTTREVGRAGLWGMGRRPSVEVVAATDIRVREHDTRGARLVPPPPVAPRLSRAASAVATPRAAPTPSTTERRLTQLEQHLSDMRSALEQVARSGRAVAVDEPPGLALEYASCYQALRDADVRRELAYQLLKDVSERERRPGATPEDRVRAAIAARIRTSGPIRVEGAAPRIVALIGPTGVGKTTTIAKLAADFTFRSEQCVGLLTVDTYRVAAIEQLKTFADIMTVPVQVASTPDEAKACLTRFSPRPDLILVDTAGRSQRNSDQIGALRELLEAVAADEIHLVLSATTKTSDLSDVVRRFGRLGADNLIFTKLDETTTFGPVLNICVEAGLPISYITSGQMVPEDFEVARSEALADLILPGSENDA